MPVSLTSSVVWTGCGEPQVGGSAADGVGMTRLLGTLLRSRQQDSAEPVSPGWRPLPDDIAEWMGMNPYPADR
jgi:hypothetical protein